MSSTQELTPTEKLKLHLREERHLKHGCDYALLHKYGETHILCHEVYEEAIREAARGFGVKVLTFHTFANRRKSKA